MGGSGRRAAQSRFKSSVDTDGDDSVSNGKSTRRSRKESRDRGVIQIIDFKLKTLLGLGFGVSVSLISIYLIYCITKQSEEVQTLRVVTPFPAPRIMDLSQFQGEHMESLYWGTYRPQVYLGIRARTPWSLIAGLVWIGVKDGRYFMWHVCQDSDELSTYGWTHHNGRDYGHQVLIDQYMTLTMSFLKTKGNGSGYGGDWAVRTNVQYEKSRLDGEMLRTAHLFFYLADEEGNALSINREGLDIHDGSLLACGSCEDVGGWELHLVSTDNLEVHYSGFRTPHVHNLTEFVQETLGTHARRVGLLQLPDASDDSPNILVFQACSQRHANSPFWRLFCNTLIFFSPSFYIAFVSGTGLKSSTVEERVNSLTGALLTSQLNEKRNDFEDEYERCFNLTEKVDSESIIVGKAAIGSLLGGIGYFYGHSQIALPRDSSLKNCDNFVPYWPAELFTAVPSRSFFPRGLLWDEGFHQLLICKVPKEFVPQHPTNGNPPTLFLILRGKDTSSYYWHGRDKQTTRELNPKEYHSMAQLLSNFEILNQVHLRWQEMNPLGSNYASRELVREVVEQPQLRFVPHIGYVKSFSIYDEDHSTRIMGPGRTLLSSQNKDGPYRFKARTIYEELRKIWIRNVIHNYFQTGYLWEQNDQNKGKGKGARPFTGWASLILLIMAEAFGEI